MLGAAVCFFVAFITLPLLVLKPAKFALSFRSVILGAAHLEVGSDVFPSLGSFLVMFGYAASSCPNFPLY